MLLPSPLSLWLHSVSAFTAALPSLFDSIVLVHSLLHNFLSCALHVVLSSSQVLEDNLNLLETKGMEMYSNKEKLKKYEEEIAALKETIKSMEKKSMLQIKTQLIVAEEQFTSQQPIKRSDTKVSDYYEETFC